MIKRTLVGTAALLPRPRRRPQPTDATLAPTGSAAFSAVKFWEVGATVSWNQLATDLATAAPAPGINAIRLYTYLSLAQFRAAEAAQAAPGPHPPIGAAIGGASVAVLSYFFPGSVAQLEAALDAQTTDPWPGESTRISTPVKRSAGAWEHGCSRSRRATSLGSRIPGRAHWTTAVGTWPLDLLPSAGNRAREPRRASVLFDVPGSAALGSATGVW
jgi:hypothetical protein